MCAHFAPDQFAVATPAGCEAIALGIRCISEVHPSYALLQVDISNAFNTVSRAAIFEGLRASPMANLIPFVRSFYSSPALLYYVQQDRGLSMKFQSSVDIRKGDPSSGALFAFGLHSALSQAKAAVPGSIFATFADDTHILAPLAAMPATFGSYTEAVAAVGLSVDVGKCRLWPPPGGTLPADLHPHLPRPTNGLHVLGVPFGGPASLEPALDAAYND